MGPSREKAALKSRHVDLTKLKPEVWADELDEDEFLKYTKRET